VVTTLVITLRCGIVHVLAWCQLFKQSLSTKVTRDAVLDPMRMILAASVCEEFNTVWPFTE